MQMRYVFPIGGIACVRCQLTLAMCSAADRVAKIAKERAKERERQLMICIIYGSYTYVLLL